MLETRERQVEGERKEIKEREDVERERTKEGERNR
jgi:hypothetical protein